MTVKENNPDTGSGQNGGYQNRKTSPPVRFGLVAIFASFHYNVPAFALHRAFISLPITQRAIRSINTGRMPTFNISYAFIGLITSQNTHIPHISLVA